MKKKKTLSILLVIFITVIIILFILVVVFNFNNYILGNAKPKTKKCSIKTEKRIVRGDSLDSLIEEGQTVKVLLGYYNCNEIQRNDIVLYRYSGNETPLIKIVSGISGDSFKLVEKEAGNWNILINGKVLKTFNGESYLISNERYKMLALYERDYKGKIPKGSYLLLGNLPYGSLDSTIFGFVSEKDILGKVEN